MTFAERFSLKTNAVDWLLLTPNISFEYDVRATNWNRWAVVLNLKSNFKTAHTFLPGIVFEQTQVRIEGRNYWRTRPFDGRYIGKHSKWIDKLFSFRRKTSKHPLTTYYRGFYLAYDRFSYLFSSEGIRGNAFTGGFTYGIVRPLYEFSNGNSLDFELGVSAGVAYAKYDKYRLDRRANEYTVTQGGLSGIYPAISDIRVGFIYRFGKYPVTKKYRYRYDVDMVYANRVDSLILLKNNRRAERIRIDTLTRNAEYKFWDKYRELTGEKRFARIRSKAERTGQNPDSLIQKINAKYIKEEQQEKAQREKAKKRMDKKLNK
ncbi:MAG: DUF3575 domain-containing protein [Bacteroidaceae bacterium]|nr:DUF3575 domain-containing protein [Bacteroidaceae bacterium]